MTERLSSPTPHSRQLILYSCLPSSTQNLYYNKINISHLTEIDFQICANYDYS